MTFNWQNPYPTIRMPVMARNVVSTSQPLAAQAGLRMLAQRRQRRRCGHRRGGDADDRRAGLERPRQRRLRDSLGRQGTGRPECLRHRSCRLEPGLFPQANTARTRMATPTSRSAAGIRVTVPGAVAAWEALHGRFGHLPFADLLQPAIEIAERGHAVAPIVAHKWAANVSDDAGPAGFRGSVHAAWAGAADRREIRLQGRRRRRCASSRRRAPRAFYEGEIADTHRRFQQGMRRRDDASRSCRLSPGMGDADLPSPIAAMTCTRSRRTARASPPSSRSASCEKFDLAGLPVDGVDSQHVQIEAMKLAFADIYRYVADPRADGR